MKSYYTQEQLEQQLIALGLEKGMRVCLQVSPDFAQQIIGGYQTIIATVMRIITKKGCLIVPTFDDENLDPSCQEEIPYALWDSVREHMLGYDKKLSSCDALANQFLKNDNVERSNHPVYSFAYWGTYRLTWLESNGDYPLSFEASLYPMNKKSGCNVLLGIKKEESLLLPAIAQVLEIGQIYVQKAKIHKPSRSSFKKYLNVRLTKEQKEDCLSKCSIKEIEWNHQSLQMLSTDIKSDRKSATSSNVSIMCLSNR